MSTNITAYELDQPGSTFVGHGELLRRVAIGLFSTPPGSYQIIGLPGMGKSTLMRYLAQPQQVLAATGNQAYSSSNIFAVRVEYRRMPTHAHPFDYLHQEMSLQYQALRQSKNLPEIPELKRPDNYQEHAVDPIMQIDAAVNQLMHQHRIRIWFLLDDFDVAVRSLVALDREGDEVTRLRPFKDKVGLILSSEVPLATLVKSAPGSNFLQIIEHRYLGGLNQQSDVQKLIQAIAGNVPSEGDMALITRYAGGHPYLTALAYGVLQDVREFFAVQSSELTSEQREFFWNCLQTEFKNPFTLYWARLSEETRRVLMALVQSREALTDDQMLSLTLPARLGLVKRAQKGDGYRLFSPLFKTFICDIYGMPYEEDPDDEPEPFSVAKRAEPLSGREKELYLFLKEKGPQGASFEDLWKKVWHGDLNTEGKEIRARIQVTISRLRSEVRKHGEDIVSIRGQGYRLIASDTSSLRSE